MDAEAGERDVGQCVGLACVDRCVGKGCRQQARGRVHGHFMVAVDDPPVPGAVTVAST